MPEIKHNFTGGKMEKDLDERLVPNGQYRDAMNIQVSTSEGSDVGTIQNILGNQRISFKGGFLLPDEAVSVGCISDEKTDTLYWFVWTFEVDYIFSYKRNDTSINCIFRDLNKDTLKFDPRFIITGINIINDLLFWTDNKTEPKKINIPRCIAGTPTLPLLQTRLINEKQNITLSSNIDIEEKHITVIKRPPLKELQMQLIGVRDSDKIYTGVVETYKTPTGYSPVTGRNWLGNITVPNRPDRLLGIEFSGLLKNNGEEIPTSHVGGPNGLTGWQGLSGGNPDTSIPVGTKFVMAPYDEDGNPPGLPITDYTLKGVVYQLPGGAATSFAANTVFPTGDGSQGQSLMFLNVQSWIGTPEIAESDSTPLKYAIDFFDETEKLFEFKFPRFSYRYKYEDGEYSPFATFTQVAFKPGAFDYHPRKGYNIGMTNTVKEIHLSGFVYPGMSEDIVSVDILFKDESSPNIYVVDTLSPNDSIDPITGSIKWNAVRNGGDYVINSETINNVVPSNQLLRPWDNVPRKALAQDITGNRIVYGNYIQNYNLIEQTIIAGSNLTNQKYSAAFNVEWANKLSSTAGSQKSIKSLREYQLGVVFLDKYGRETPVISNNSGTIVMPKNRADLNNQVKVQLLGNPPEELTHFKFFIKETAGQYYNMAMDRWYNAEDNNVWLAFPSSDRNKIDIDTFLILKKGADTDNLIAQAGRYKVLAIENEAPDYIKTTVEQIHSNIYSAQNEIFDTSGDLPLQAETNFELKYDKYFNTSAQSLDTITNADLYVEFGKVGTDEVSERYKVSEISKNWSVNQSDSTNNPGVVTLSESKYKISVKEPFGSDVDFANTGGVMNLGTTVNFYKYKVENRPQFDGRFFVKIFFDDLISTEIVNAGSTETNYIVRESRPIYRMKSDNKARHTTAVGRCLTNGAGHAVTQVALGDNINTGVIGVLDKRIAAKDISMGLDGAGGRLQLPAGSGKSAGYGYYRADSFSSMAMFFRRYANDNSLPTSSNTDIPLLVHLKPTTSGGIEYKTNSRTEKWEAQDDWELEFGVQFYNPNQVTGMRGSKKGWFPFDGVNKFEIFQAAGLRKQSVPDRAGYTANWMPYIPANAIGTNEDDYLLAESSNRGNAENARDTEVWFIDEGPYIGSQQQISDNLDWLNSSAAGGNVYPNVEAFRAGLVTETNRWYMDLGFGGIQSKSIHNGNNVPNWWEGFWNTGDWNSPGNEVSSFYKDIKTKKFVNSLNFGKKFRWKEDPNQTIYTIGNPFGGGMGAGQGNLMRHSNTISYNGTFSDWPIWWRTAGGNTVERLNSFFYWVTSQNANPNSGDNALNAVRDKFGASSAATSMGQFSMAEEVGFNFSKNWRFYVSPALNWDPTQNGAINGGISINIASVTNGNFTAEGISPGTDLKIFVEDIKGNANSINENELLKVGMALQSYTNTNGKNFLGSDIGANANNLFVVRNIIKQSNYYEIWLGGYDHPFSNIEHTMAGFVNRQPTAGTDFVFVQVGMNGYSPNSEFNINTMGSYIGVVHPLDPSSMVGAVGAVGYTLEFIEEKEPDNELSENPAIWETEPKDTKDLDIYYEASSGFPINELTNKDLKECVPVGSRLITRGVAYTIVGHNDDKLVFYNLDNIFQSEFIDKLGNPDVAIIKPDGTQIHDVDIDTSYLSGSINQLANIIIQTQELKLGPLFNSTFRLNWHNCFSFGNGVESNRIRDNFNLPFIVNGVKASTTVEQEYQEEHRKYGLIYSGIYNSNSGVNNLNQFIQAEKITKDINPIYGSIQKLHSRDGDLVTLCEDKILKILANKDAVFNADGNPQLIATPNVLGQTTPFSGEYGISTNPESFASESYRAYFTDKVRGAVIRLSRDGITPISNFGMKDWFKDNLKLSNRLIGSYDDKKEEYNLTLKNILYTTGETVITSTGTSTSSPVTVELSDGRLSSTPGFGGSGSGAPKGGSTQTSLGSGSTAVGIGGSGGSGGGSGY